MKLIFLLLCFTGAVLVTVSILPPARHKYHVIMAEVTWPKAQNYCRVMYDDLATIETDDDWVRLEKEITSTGLNSRAWVGLYNQIDSWRWSLNDLPLKNITLRSWRSGYPDNNGGDAWCVIINSDGYWLDQACTDTRGFICFNASNSGADRFVGVARPEMTWNEAQNYCRTFHTDLASALNQTDNDLLAQVARQQGNSWIGLFRDTWKWSDGTNTSNVKWDSGEPNNSDRDENCAAFDSGKFTDRSCTKLFYFICHTILPVREQQIMRVQVMSDGSVFDPAVQSAILEQIKQKLEENGMLENTTVTWRVQLDGNIFYKKNNDSL